MRVIGGCFSIESCTGEEGHWIEGDMRDTQAGDRGVVDAGMMDLFLVVVHRSFQGITSFTSCLLSTEFEDRWFHRSMIITVPRLSLPATPTTLESKSLESKP